MMWGRLVVDANVKQSNKNMKTFALHIKVELHHTFQKKQKTQMLQSVKEQTLRMTLKIQCNKTHKTEALGCKGVWIGAKNRKFKATKSSKCFWLGV